MLALGAKGVLLSRAYMRWPPQVKPASLAC